MPPQTKINPPKNDDEYFETMSRAIFQAGLNWEMIDNKWSNFRKAFSNFSVDQVSKFNSRKVKELLSDSGIVRNEKKITSTIYNAQQSLAVQREFGSFRKYIDSFGKDHAKLMEDLQSRFHHLGSSSSRTFLWMAGVKLVPTEEEKRWMATHKHAHA
jgi:3-methyladenine DNA glycosylase Tag